MKERIYLLAGAVLILSLTNGCGGAFPENRENVESKAASEEADLTKEDVIARFSEYDRDTARYQVTDSVLAEDFAYGLIGVVQYTDKDGNPCNLAFVKEDGRYQSIGLAADNDYRIAQDSVLTYAGNGVVELSLVNKVTGEILDYTVEYSASENKSSVHFDLRSEPRGKEQG